jgi:ferredoxin-NADP reductase
VEGCDGRARIAKTSHVETIMLDAPGWPGHCAGQYVDVRLTDESGYQTERAYAIASAPEDPQLALSVERIPGGEVSQYLTERLGARDRLELRGPVGAHFTWPAVDGGPLVLLASGSGLAPLMAMLRHRAARSSTVETRLLLWARHPQIFVYGATPFVDAAASLLARPATDRARLALRTSPLQRDDRAAGHNRVATYPAGAEGQPLDGGVPEGQRSSRSILMATDDQLRCRLFSTRICTVAGGGTPAATAASPLDNAATRPGCARG